MRTPIRRTGPGPTSLAALAVFALPAPQDARPALVDVQTASVTDSASHTYAVERGRVRVPENRARAGSGTIEVGFARVRSTATKPGTPIVYLEGGPGQPASPIVDDAAALSSWAGLLGVADVIFLDQRGTGTSRPNLGLAMDESLPREFFADRALALRYAIGSQARCRAHFEAQGVDLAAYNTVQNADDVDDLRAALGLEKISVLGFSYGTLLGLTVVQRHDEHLERVALIGAEGANDWGSLPTKLQTQIRKLSLLAARDPGVNHAVPDMTALLDRVLKELEEKPLDVEVFDRRTKQNVVVPLGRYGFELLMRIDLGDGNDFPLFPALLWTIDQGRTDVVKRFLEKRWNQLSRGASGMSTPMTLASWPAPWLLARFALERGECSFQHVVNYFDLKIAGTWAIPQLPDDFRAPILTDVPTLFVSGTLDSNAPPYQAETARYGFLESTHIVIDNAGHEDMLPHPEVRDVLRRFFSGEDVSAVRIAFPPPSFVAIRKP